jgi:Zn-dependent protease
MLRNSVFLNLLLAVFNMIPLPPLDGGRVAVGLLPAGLARPLAKLERTGMLILIAVLFFLPQLSWSLIGVRLDLFQGILLPIVSSLWDLIFLITCHI